MSRLAVILVMVSTTAILLALQCFFGDIWEDWGYVQKTLNIMMLVIGWEGLKFSRRLDDVIAAHRVEAANGYQAVEFDGN